VIKGNYPGRSRVKAESGVRQVVGTQGKGGGKSKGKDRGVGSFIIKATLKKVEKKQPKKGSLIQLHSESC